MDLISRKIRGAKTESHENRNHQCKLSITFPQKDQNRKLIMKNIQRLHRSNEQSQKKIQARNNEDKNQRYRNQDKDPVFQQINLIFLNQLLDINIKFENEDFQAFTIQKSPFKNHYRCSVEIKRFLSQPKENNHFLTHFILWQKTSLLSKFVNFFRSTTMF